ncbi:Bro18 [Heliothis virescens ascovirus 3e]|uniref:Bro18 n=1 Tax=Heliothis virescens ascovirus 3e TaxID=260797 RepID=A4KXK4_HVAVE|nr:anti-repressor Ant [Heliothis virescens ascovirus 3e]ABO37335.1 Bro18 [Heliothis virescens ascovirus 3e]
MASLTKCSYTVGRKRCEVWIVEIPRDGKDPLFMVSAHGIAELLGYKQPAHAVKKHVRPKHRKTWEEIKGCMIHTPLDVPPNWQPNTVFITEPGIYALCDRSRLPEAEEFQDWIYEDVLPSIRRTGSYNIHDRNGTSVAEYDKKLADGQIELMKAQLLVANLQTQLSNHGAEITQTVAKYDARIAELQLENEKVVSKYDARIAGLQLENEKTISALKSEHQNEIAAVYKRVRSPIMG